MSITYAANSCMVKTPPLIEIQGKNYRYVKAGNLFVLAEELELNVQSGYGYPKYYYNDVPFYRNQNSTVQGIIDDFISSNPGWRTLKNTDWAYLASNFNMGILSTSWQGGTNATGINIPYCPDYSTSRVVGWWYLDQWGNHAEPYIDVDTVNQQVTSGNGFSLGDYCVLRLCKDVI